MPPHEISSKSTSSAERKTSIWEVQEVSKVMKKEVHRIKMWNWLANRFDTDAAERCENNPSKMIPFDTLNAPKKVQEELSERFVLSTTKVIKRQESVRGDTTKLLIECHDGHQIETVVMRHSNYSTVCVSSQVGCKMGCKFCATGTMGIIRNLTAGEILEQVAHANSVSRIRNVVFMGMGEPLNNYESIKDTISVLVDQRLFSMSPKHLTVSTVGVLKEMRRLEDEFPLVNFALSLHAPNQSVRLKIVPTASANAYEDLLAALDYRINHERERRARKEAMSGKTGHRHTDEDRISSYTATIMIEYILLHGVNDMPELAHELGQVLKPRKNFILLNLIPYNPTDVGDAYEPPSDIDIRKFHEILVSEEYRIHTRVRKEMGQDIDGACGQLVVEHQKRGKGKGKGKEREDALEIEDISLVAKKPTSGTSSNSSNSSNSGIRDKKRRGKRAGLSDQKKTYIVAGCAVVAALSCLFVFSRVRQRS